MSAPSPSIDMGSAEPYVDMESTKSKNDMASVDAAAPVYIGTGVAPPRLNHSALVSMICGIASFVVGTIILGPLAIIFGMYAIKEIDGNPGLFEGRPMAKAGIICGIIAIAIQVIAFVIVMIMMYMAQGSQGY